MSPDEHASHHRAGNSTAPAANNPAGMAAQPPTTGGVGSGMGSPVTPASTSPNSSGMGAPSGGMGGSGMGEMMKGMMGGSQQTELYPTLMALPVVSAEQRLQLQQQAEAREKTGSALLQEGTARMANPQANDLERQEGAAEVRTGLRELESGRSARRALAEGHTPRAVALQWFKAEMNPASAIPTDVPDTPLGDTPFHLFTMALLIAFALAMIAMYFFKMRRAAALFGRLDSKPGLPPGAVPPLAGIPETSPPGAPPTGKPASPAVKTLLPSGPAPPLPTAVPSDNSPPSGSPPSGSPPSGSPPSGSPPGEASLRFKKEMLKEPVTANWRGLLRVGSIVTETPNVKTFRLLPTSDDRRLPFVFVPGQFLNVAFAIGGARMNRSYSISSSPLEREFVELTVRREPRGAVSRHIDDLIKVGDEIEVGGPVGKFTFNGTESDSVVLISGGVGITPMMSITRYLTALSWPGEIFFIYTARFPADFMFATEIAALQRRNPKLHVAVTLTGAEGTDWKGARGRITKEWLTQTVPDLAARRTHLCGPPAMMDAIMAIFTELGIAPDHLKTEAFGAVKPAPAAPGAAKPAGPATGPLVTFSKSGKSAKTHLDLQTGDSPPTQSILELSEELSIGIEFSCRVGTCGICKTKLTSGEVDQEVQDALDDDDKAKGIILACQAKPKNDVTVEA